MADPVLDEDYIIELLRVPVKAATIDRIQAGAVQALMDLFDRKCTRDEFLSLASRCISLYGQTAKMWMLSNIAVVHEEGTLDKKTFDVAIKGLEQIIRVQSEAVVEIVQRLQMCPSSRDKVH